MAGIGDRADRAYGFSWEGRAPRARGPKASEEVRAPTLLALKIGIRMSRGRMRIADSFGPTREGIDLAIRANRVIGAALVPPIQTIPGAPILL